MERRSHRNLLNIALRLGSLACLLLFLMPATLSAQQAAAAINGTVSDATGSIVPGATITLSNNATGVSRTTQSNSSGIYNFVDVQPASYAMKVAKEGFSTLTQSDIVMQVNQTATYDFKLRVGATQQTIEVEATAAAIEASTSELGTVINEAAVQDLPLNGRNFTQLLTLTPGASPVSVAQNSGGGGGFAGNAIGSFSYPALNGQRNRSNMFLMDGIVDLGSFIGNYNVQPIIDTVQEFKVQSHNDLAEWGQAPGGIVNVVTKSGTNAYHIVVWEFLRNNDLDANGFFANSFGAPRNALHQNQFGVAGGGPVIIPKLYNGRNKTFFYGGYEGFRQTVAAQNTGLAPTTAQINGNFQGFHTIYNPATGNPFPNNIIPASSINPMSAAYAAVNFPTGPYVASGNNYINNSPTNLQQNTYSIRVDQTFGEHDSLFARVSQYWEPQTSSDGYAGATNFANDYGSNGAIHEIHTFGPTAVLEGFFGRNLGNADTGSTPLGVSTGLANNLITLGMNPNFIGNFQGTTENFVPGMGASGYLGGAGQSLQDTEYSDSWVFGGSFTKIIGRHTLKMGANFATNNTLSPIYNTSEGFAPVPTQSPTNPQTNQGDSFASFLIGLPDNGGRRNVLETEHGGWVNGFYFQDQFKVNSRLTVNLGIRWDVTLWPIYGQPPAPDAYVGDVDLNNGTYILARQPGACTATQGYPCIPGGTLPANVTVTTHSNGSIYTNDHSDWQPRVGLAYRLTDKTAIRGGFGRFYDNWNSIIQLAQNYEGTWPDIGQLLAQNLNHPGGTSASIGNPFNLGSGSVVYPAATPFLSSGFVDWYVDPGTYKMPWSDQWDVSLEQGLGNNIILSLAYVGSHDGQLNQGSQGNTSVSPGTISTEAERRPYPYIPPTFYDKSVGQSTYNAFQFRLQQRETRGLSYIISYTYSKSIDTGCSGSFGAEGCEIQYVYNYENDRSVSGFNLPNIFSGSFVYNIPVGKGKSLSTGNNFADYILGNWQLSGILSLYSGTPFDVTMANGDTSGTGNNVTRANLLMTNPYLSGQGPLNYLNPAAFGSPTVATATQVGAFGNLGRNSLRTDSYHNFDMSVTRDFPIKERANLQFRCDFFNLTNSVVFGGPQSTLGNPNFGVITSTANVSRIIQFAMKLTM
jgi:outer membrane receptor protein involved in Fe transport